MDIITLALAKKSSKSYVDNKLDAITTNMDYKGSVSSVEDLPATATAGDIYSIGGERYLYNGTTWEKVTTTVSDGSLTEEKFSDALKLKAIKDYVTPEMYGAKGDGITDDATAIKTAFDSGSPVKFSPKTYLVKSVLNVVKTPLIDGNGATIDVQLSTPSDASYGAIRALGNSAHSGTKRISNLKIEINTPSATSGDFVAMQFNGYDVFMDNVDIYIPSTSVNWHGLFCINDRTVLSNVRIENLAAGNHQGGAFWVRGNLSDAHVFCVNSVFISMAKDETIAFYGKSDGSTTVQTTLINCVIQRQYSENFIADWTMAVYNNSSLLAKNCVIDSYTTGADCCKTPIRVGGTDVNDASNAVFENCKITASATVCLVSGPNTGTHGFNKENRVAFNQCSISCNVPVIGRFHDYGQTGKAMPGLPTEFNGCDIVCEEIVFDPSNTNSTTQTCAIRDSRVEINNALYIFGALYQNNYMFIISNSIVIGNALTYEIRTNALATTSQSASAPPVTPALKTVINSCYNETALTELRAGRL